MIGIFIILLLLVFGASRYALGRYESAMNEGAKEKAPLPLTGAEIARDFLESSDAGDVEVVEHNGVVTDYFDPARRRLFLRKEFFEGQTLAAWAVALHEAGHAVQTGEALPELNWRRSCIKMTRYVPMLALILGVTMKFLLRMPMLPVIIGIAGIWAAVMLLNIGSLAVERNANLRLRKFLEQRLARHGGAKDKLESLLGSVALREVGDLVRSPRYFFFSALPGTSKMRPR